MTDRESAITQGKVKWAWFVGFEDGTEALEYGDNESLVKLDSVDWDKAVSFGAYYLEDPNKHPVIKFKFKAGDKPIWFHRMTGQISMGNPRVDVVDNLDFVGIESEDYKHYCECSEDVVTIHFERKAEVELLVQRSSASREEAK